MRYWTIHRTINTSLNGDCSSQIRLLVFAIYCQLTDKEWFVFVGLELIYKVKQTLKLPKTKLDGHLLKNNLSEHWCLGSGTKLCYIQKPCTPSIKVPFSTQVQCADMAGGYEHCAQILTWLLGIKSNRIWAPCPEDTPRKVGWGCVAHFPKSFMTKISEFCSTICDLAKNSTPFFWPFF